MWWWMPLLAGRMLSQRGFHHEEEAEKRLCSDFKINNLTTVT
jgi:hypothetical protein